MKPDVKKMDCGTCNYHEHEEIDDGYVCVNPDSEYCTEWTEDDFGCGEWEGKHER